MRTNANYFNRVFSQLKANGKAVIKTNRVQDFLDFIKEEYGCYAMRGEKDNINTTLYV